MAVALYDEPGPRGRLLITVFSVLAVVLVLVPIVGFVIWRLNETDQFRSEYWEPFGGAGVQRILFRGLIATLRAAGLALVLALALGVLLAVGRLSEKRAIRWVSGTVVELFRALPLVFLIFFAFIGLPRLGIDTDPFSSVVIGLTLYNGSVLAEIFRAGIIAVPRGQSEAAYSIGLRKASVLRRILIPQAVRTMLPTLVSQMVVLLKDSALGFIVAYPELLRSGRRIYTNVGNVIPTAIVIAAVYITINLALTTLAGYLERRQGGGRSRGGADLPPEVGIGAPGGGGAPA